MIAGDAGVTVGILLGLGTAAWGLIRQARHVSKGRGRWFCAYCRAPLVNAYATVCSKCGRAQPPTS